MIGWHHQVNGHKFVQTLGDSEGRGSLACCSPCHAWLLHSQPTLWDPVDCSLPGSSVHEDSPGKATGVSCQSSSRGSSDTGIEPVSLKSPAWAGGFFTTSTHGKPMLQSIGLQRIEHDCVTEQQQFLHLLQNSVSFGPDRSSNCLILLNLFSIYLPFIPLLQLSNVPFQISMLFLIPRALKMLSNYSF